MWVKISDDLYARKADPDPAEVISISEVEKRISEIEEEQKSVKSIKTSESYPDDVNEAIEFYNSYFRTTAGSSELDTLNDLLGELLQVD